MTLENVALTAIRVKDADEHDSDYTLLTAEEVGIGERALVSPGVTTIRGRDADDQFVELLTIKEPQTDSDTFQIDFFGHYDLVETLTKFKLKNKKFFVQLLSFATPPVDIPTLAKKIEHYLVLDTGMALGAGRNRDGSAGLRENSISVSAANRVITNLSQDISSLTNSLTEDVMSMAMLTRDLDRLTGYRGPDKVIFVGLDDDTTNPGVVAVSVNGGSTFAELTTDPDPFAGVAGIDNMVLNILDEDSFRIITGRATVAATKAEFAYGDLDYGSETADPGWTVITIAATANADAVEALLWPQASRLYVAAAGDIYLSTDRGETDPGAAIFTGANALAKFAYDFERNVWAVGASNTILLEKPNARGTFTAKTGPSGGGAFTYIARAKDGIIFAGNGTSIFRNTNKANTAGGWTSLKDFGANHAVEHIQCVRGSSQILRAVVNDSTATEGDIWYSINGGETWTEVTDVANEGYLAAVHSETDDDLLYAGGVVSGSNPIIHKYG